MYSSLVKEDEPAYFELIHSLPPNAVKFPTIWKLDKYLLKIYNIPNVYMELVLGRLLEKVGRQKYFEY